MERIVFPEELDGAEVLYFTYEGDYGEMRYENGEIAEYYKYLAICQYKNDNGVYLFCCNKNHEVVGDSLWSTIDECMNIANNSYCQGIEWLDKTNYDLQTREKLLREI